MQFRIEMGWTDERVWLAQPADWIAQAWQMRAARLDGLRIKSVVGDKSKGVML